MNFVSTHDEKQLTLQVVLKNQVADSVIEFEFKNAHGGGLPAWSAGAHIDLKLANGLVRQYSLVRGSAHPNNWKIAVLIEEDGRGGSKYLRDSVQPGDELAVIGPRNHFGLEDAGSYLFVAGGIGVTPLIEMLRTVDSKGKVWKLAYLGRRRENMAYLAELVEEFGGNVEAYISSEGSKFNVEQALEALDAGAHVYSCGPENLMQAIERSAPEGDLNRVHVERFHPKEIEISVPDHEFTVYCAKSDVEIVVPADESIFMAADFEGIELEGDCMEGTCGSCETRVIEGEIDHRDSVLSAASQKDGDTMMICVSRCKGNRLVLDL